VSAETPALAATAPRELTSVGRWLILAAAFFGWLFAGVQMSLMNLASRAAATEFLRSGQLTEGTHFVFDQLIQPAPGLRNQLSTVDEKRVLKKEAPRCFAWFNSAFLFGAATGGFVFGRMGDRFGRAKAMSLSIGCYSALSAVAYLARTPEQFLLLRFFAGLGVGGMWPTGVSLASEAWPERHRPMLSGMLGTSANVGIVLISVAAYFRDVTPDSWRWLLLLGSVSIVLAVLVWIGVPESPRWLAARAAATPSTEAWTLPAVFRPPLLKLTLIGIALGTIPLLGGWGVTAWFIPWTDKVMEAVDPRAKAFTAIMRAGGATIGGLLGGWIANVVGRRLTFFLISLSSFVMGEYIYSALTPTDGSFQYWVFALGGVSTLFFGWLPLYLPELFPTTSRATGSGVSFNFGRILTAMGVLGTGALTQFYQEDYAAAGRVTTLIYAIGMIVILFAPDTTKRSALSDQPSAST
jgi:MFS family permease